MRLSRWRSMSRRRRDLAGRGAGLRRSRCRRGRIVAVVEEGVGADRMTVAKGLSGGYLPLAATFATQKIFEAFLGRPEEGKTLFHGHTFTGNPLACAAAVANLELMERRDTVGNV